MAKILQKNLNKTWEKEFEINQHFTVGLADDIDRFLHLVYNQFEEVDEGPRMSIFVEEWKRTSFGLIFNGRENFREIFELTKEIFDLVKTYAVALSKGNENPLGLRYAAIYLLYALYFKQPCRPKIKIRLIFQEFKDLQMFVDEAKNDKHYDLVFAWTKLFTENAFHYSATQTQLGPETAFMLEKKETVEENIKRRPVDWFASKEFLRMMGRITKKHQMYASVKETLIQQKGEANRIFITDTNLPEMVKKIVEETSCESNVIEEKTSNDIGNLRKNIKDRYFSSGNVESHRDRLFVEGRVKAEVLNRGNEEWTPDKPRGKKAGKKGRPKKSLTNQAEKENQIERKVRKLVKKENYSGLGILKQLKNET